MIAGRLPVRTWTSCCEVFRGDDDDARQRSKYAEEFTPSEFLHAREGTDEQCPD